MSTDSDFIQQRDDLIICVGCVQTNVCYIYCQSFIKLFDTFRIAVIGTKYEYCAVMQVYTLCFKKNGSTIVIINNSESTRSICIIFALMSAGRNFLTYINYMSTSRTYFTL